MYTVLSLLVAGVFCLTAATEPAMAGDYYVDPVNGDDSYPGTTAAPWRTLAKAKGESQPGDIVRLRTGNYGTAIFDNSDTSGTSWSNKITYEADTGHTPVFSRIRFESTTKDWYTEFNGITIEVTDAKPNVYLLYNVHHLRFLNLTLDGGEEWERHDIPYVAAHAIDFESGAGSFEDILIDGCEITKCETGIRLWGNFGTGVVVSNNNIHFIGGFGIKLSSLADSEIILIEGNHIHNQVAIGGPGVGESHGSGIEIRSSHATIRNNIIHDFGNSCGLRTYGTPADGPYHDLLIENNLIYDIYNYADNAVWLMNSGSNVVFRNNTIVGMHTDNSGRDWYQRPFRVSSPSGSGGFALYNNVIVGKVEFLDGSSPDGFTGNIMWSCYSNGVWQSSSPGNIIVNPGDSSQPDYFENPGNFFVGSADFTYAVRHRLNLNNAFQLAENSPAIGYAGPAYATTTDLLDNPRDAQPDAGCYEYMSGPADSTPPSAPQNITAQVISESQINLSWQQSTDPESGISYYRIYRDDNPAATPASTMYSDKGLSAGTEYSYQVSAINGQGLESARSNIASATTFQDTTPPAILSAGAASETTVTVVFSEALEAASAEDVDNYDITGGISVASASLAGDLMTVTLTTSSHAEDSYTLTVQAVRDTAGNPITVTDSVDYDYTNGLIAHWKFDEATGSTAFDSSGSGHDGTLVNGPTWTTGRLGGALRFDGTNPYVDTGAQDVAPPWSASLWVKREDSLNSNTALLDSSNYSLKLEQYPNLNKVGFTAYGVADYAFDYEAPEGTWVHLVFAGTSTETKLYVNGALTDAIAVSISCPMSQISSTSKAVKGTLDEVRIYGRALGIDEITELYNQATGPDTEGPVISNVQASNVTSSGATITWSTDENSTGQVEYGMDTGYGNLTALDGGLVNSHSAAITGLSASTTYHYRVRSADASENESVSQDYTLNTSDDSPPPTYTISATISGTGGSITPAGDVVVNQGSTQTFTVTPSPGYHVADVVVDLSSVGPVPGYTFTSVSADHDITATFAINTHTLDITAVNGSVTKNPDKTSYNHGETVTLQPTANVGYHFANWTGAVTGSANPATLVMDADKSVTAAFAVNTYAIAITAVNGSVIRTPDKAIYNYGETLTLQAVPDTGYNFASWGGDAWGGANPVTLTIDSNKSVTANFTYAIVDNTPPAVAARAPAADSIQVPLNSLTSFHIVDSGEGVDANTVIIEINGNRVYEGDLPDSNTAYGHCWRLGNRADYAFIFQPREAFDFDQTVTVTVNAEDLADNAMSHSYSFRTEMHSFGQNTQVSTINGVNPEGAAAAATDALGNIWAAWHSGPEGSRDVYIGSLPAGAQVFAPSRRLTDDADQCNAVLAAAGNKLYVVWQDNRQGQWDIYLSTSDDGANWSAAIPVTDANDDQTNPVIVVDGLGNVHVAWQDHRDGNWDIYAASSGNDFLNKTEWRITSDGSHQTEPAVAATSNNTLYVVWTDGRNASGDIYGAASNTGWTNIPIVTTAANQSAPAIAAEAVGSLIHLLWVDDRSGDEDIYYAASNGLPGSPLSGSSIVDDTSAADQFAPVISATGSTGADLKVFACWQDERNLGTSGDVDLYFAEIASGSTANIFVGDQGTNSDQTQPAIGTDAFGRPYLAWTDDRNGRLDIYYAGATYTSPDPLVLQYISAQDGGTVGDLSNIDSPQDICVIIPAGGCTTDVVVSISSVENPPLVLNGIMAGYEIGPSGLEFSQPVTVVIPYETSSSDSKVYTAYWYNPKSGALSQQGITNIEKIKISSTLRAVRFQTTHFTQFFIAAVTSSSSGGGGGGGCSISRHNEGSLVEFMLPYLVLTLVMLVIKVRDKRLSRARSSVQGKG
ncbi:MAG: InlB B-repeat-containing protein [Planctomycetota bacterium]|jgi:fibronectin type 3 domain-containing protein